MPILYPSLHSPTLPESEPSGLLNQHVPVPSLDTTRTYSCCSCSAPAHVSLSIRWVIYKVDNRTNTNAMRQLYQHMAEAVHQAARPTHMCCRSGQEQAAGSRGSREHAASTWSSCATALLLPIYHLPFSSFFTSGQCTKPFPCVGSWLCSCLPGCLPAWQYKDLCHILLVLERGSSS